MRFISTVVRSKYYSCCLLLLQSSSNSLVQSFTTLSSPSSPSKNTKNNNFIHTTRFSSAASQQREGKEVHTKKMSSTASPAIIDVDCNLSHSDLVSFVTTFDGNIQKEEKEQENSPPYKQILSHPSTIKSNIIGVFSPSSTITESELSVKTLPPSFDIFVEEEERKRTMQIRTSVGVHPYHVAEVGSPDSNDDNNNLERLISILKGKKEASSQKHQVLSCIGECGLDYSPTFPSPNLQKEWFRAQVKLACEYELPLFIHERLAFDNLCEILDEEIISPKKILIHCFTGTQKECQEYIKRGYYISISGYIFKENQDNYQEVRNCLIDNTIPLDKLMIETDAPYMGFNDCRSTYFDNLVEEETEAFHQNLNGKKRKRLLKGIYPNVPSSLTMVLEGVTELLNENNRDDQRKLSIEDVAKVTTQNAIDFFGFEKPKIVE